ncbi:unnamed protein product [Adineta ricciae]|uniref:G-protein coupled receptors family 1 profile domain-containing protein n=1 Tax=Adineta ricciae TaxID=249248 RepID=A0A814CWU9_ADIRI|nr:unnamed protein product [Adineta ricciae]CAF1158210.1 unnamed protein product [Adineta ricciae]
MVTPELLISISQWLTIILGICFITFGLFGSLMNLLIFSHRRFRNISSSQYILIQSISDMITLCVALLVQVIVNGFVWPYFFTIQFLCSFRGYASIVSTQTALYSKCLIAFDIWSSTSRHASIRQWNNLNRARFLILINILIWVLFSIPYAILGRIFLIKNVWQCAIIDPTFLNYHGYFFIPCLTLFLPVLALSFFGYYSYVHLMTLNALHQRRRLKRQFVRMILIQIFVTIISFVPYTLQYTYSTVTANWQKNSQWLAFDSLIVQISRIGFFISNVIEFYIYVTQSRDVRLTLQQIFKNFNLIRRHNDVLPTSIPMGNTNTH